MEYDLKHCAYMGDVVWEMFIREFVITKTTSQKLMHKMTTNYVNAQAQANFLEKIIQFLTPEELEIQKRARNLKITINKRNNPKIHALATSFEGLIGYWYLYDKSRLDEILEILKKEL